MLFLRYFFVIASILVLASVFFCLISAVRKHTRLSSIFIRLQLTAFIAVFSCLCFYYIENPIAANLIWAVYLLQIDMFLVCMIKFITYAEESENKKSARFFKYFYYVLLTAETVLLFTNFKTKLVYEISRVTVDDIFTTWSVNFHSLYLLHNIICYSAALTVCYNLIRKVIFTNKIKRPAYISLLVLFIFTFFMDTLFECVSNQWIYNYSSILLGSMLIILYYVTVRTVPTYVQKHLMSISSENISDAIICFDEIGNVAYCNKKGREIYSPDNNLEILNKYIESENDVLVGTERIKINNELRFYKIEFRRIRDSKNKNCGCYLKLTDCTKEIESIEQEAYKATHDELTGLYKREFFYKEMSRILKEEPDVPRYLICTDIKNFKLINELFGPDFGDHLLVRQAEMLKKAQYPGTIWGRISGDRYAMLIRQSDFNEELAAKNSSSIIEMENEVNFKLVIYISVYTITDPTENVHTMYDKATLAIKNIPAGENKVLVHYNSGSMSKLILEKSIVSEFDNALLQNQFEMYLQPQVNAKTGGCMGGEALVRWNHPERGLLYPDTFIKVFEKTDQIYKLDFYIWEQAAIKLAEWKEKNIDLNISVNISIKDFYYSDLYEYFTKLVEKYDIQASRLNLEITESVINNDRKHCETLRKLQEYGFIIEMDDFGSGYSSLNALKNVSMNVLKLDMGFLRNTENIEKAKLVILNLVKMAKALNMTVVSEGVETQIQADVLSEYGVDIFQGYLFSKPITVKDFELKYLEGK